MIAAILLLAIPALAPATDTHSWRQTLDAIRQVETGGEPNGGVGAVGDGGKALGPFQIWKPYFQDAAQRDKALTSHRSCLNSQAYSERVVRAYMDRYARAALRRLEARAGTLADVETVARIHNGGPRANRADRRKYTDRYWRKVRGKVLR